jgi:hypothetical protein
MNNLILTMSLIVRMSWAVSGMLRASPHTPLQCEDFPNGWTHGESGAKRSCLMTLSFWCWCSIASLTLSLVVSTIWGPAHNLENVAGYLQFSHGSFGHLAYWKQVLGPRDRPLTTLWFLSILENITSWLCLSFITCKVEIMVISTQYEMIWYVNCLKQYLSDNRCCMDINSYHYDSTIVFAVVILFFVSQWILTLFFDQSDLGKPSPSLY